MDRYYSMSLLLLAIMALMPNVHSWSAIPTATKSINGHQRNEVSPYLDLVLCPIQTEPWSCARQQSGRILDIWDTELHSQWQKLKVEADQQLNATLERRGYSASELEIKEKPSTILKKIEIGTNYMKEYLTDTLDGFLGREYDYYIPNFNGYNEKLNDEVPTKQQELDETENDDEIDDETDDDAENNNEDDEDEGDVKNTAVINNDNTSNGNEFFEIETHDNGEQQQQTTASDEVKDAGNRFRKRKNKKKGNNQHEFATQAANLLVIQQPLEHQLAEQQHHVEEIIHKVKPIKRKGKPLKQKRRNRKKKGHQALDDDTATVVVEQEPSTDHLSLGLLEALSDVDVLEGGGKRKKHPLKYVTRGKKKKKKKAIQKLILLGSFLKAKIELLLKILGAHLQIKFFAIALIGLLINIARFWIDVKRGGIPQKVVYVEHAHHQHHYEDHGEDWNESGGGYWKRSLQTDTPLDEYDSSTDSYQPRPVEPQQAYDAQYMAYRNQWQRK
ncbi:uncharacterized protein isoform X1 [Musca autumnalis]|uniref:uncharacterized protein isoform X1 n=1 Tax=Musca autumnalis TaxID=221902 RepID=UPI003CEBB0D3